MRDEDELAPGSCNGDIETAVVKDERAAPGTNERQNHDVALAALEALDRIDSDPGILEPLPKQHNLCSERRHDADGLSRHSVLLLIPPDQFFHRIHLRRIDAFFGP